MDTSVLGTEDESKHLGESLRNWYQKATPFGFGERGGIFCFPDPLRLGLLEATSQSFPAWLMNNNIKKASYSKSVSVV